MGLRCQRLGLVVMVFQRIMCSDSDGEEKMPNGYVLSGFSCTRTAAFSVSVVADMERSSRSTATSGDQANCTSNPNKHVPI